jgi:RNA polymerase sigma-70 factor (ECF subfamily)
VTRRDENDQRWAQLARRVAAGHAASARQLVIELLPRVRNLVRYLVRGDQDVDDLSQDAVLLILQGIGSYRGEGAFRSWADRVVARSVFTARKSESRRAEQPAPLPDVAQESAALPDGYYLRRQVVERLDGLPLPQRDALVLHHVMGLSIAEVAAELTVPEETVRSRIRLGKERLRQQLTDPVSAADGNGTVYGEIGKR